MGSSRSRVGHRCTQGSGREPSMLAHDQSKDHEDIEEKAVEEAILTADWIGAKCPVAKDILSKVVVKSIRYLADRIGTGVIVPEEAIVDGINGTVPGEVEVIQTP